MELTATLYDSKKRISKLEPEDFKQLYLIASDKVLWSGHSSKG